MNIYSIWCLLSYFSGGNIICLDFWGRRCGPFIYFLHFSLSLGFLIGPFVIQPLAKTHIPKIVQNFALPHSTGKNNTPLQSFPTTETYSYNAHGIVKRSISSFTGHTSHDGKEAELSQKGTNVPRSITPDPLLVKLFVSTNAIRKRCAVGCIYN